MTTWGELADQGAPMVEAFDLVVKLAAKVRQIPVTKGLGPGQCWVRKLPDSWVLYMNGWPHDAVHDGHKILALHALGVKDGLPLIMFGPFDGSQIGGDGSAEASLIAALRAELES